MARQASQEAAFTPGACGVQAAEDRFCPKCGGPLAERAIAAGAKRLKVCERCGYIHYLNPKVAACTVPVLGGKALLLERAVDPGRGQWVFPGGFVDRGETLQEAAARETLEEVGLVVQPGPLVGLYSYRGSPVVVAVYRAAIVSGEARALAEATRVDYFGPAAVPWAALAFRSTTEALRDLLGQVGGGAAGGFPEWRPGG